MELSPNRIFRFGFVIEQTMGHITHGQNLQRLVADDPTVQSSWGLPAWTSGRIRGKLPLYSQNWTMQAGLKTRHILAGMQRQIQPEALFFHTQVTAVLAKKWLKRIPSIVSIDATPRQIDRLGAAYQHNNSAAWLEDWKWRLNRDCFKQARRLVSWSEWAKTSLVEEYDVPDWKISVIAPGVDLPEWETPNELKPTTKPIRILFVGGDFERKGGEVLLEAFRSLRQTALWREMLELHIVTRDPLPLEPGMIVYNGLKPNSARLKELYHSSDIFCLPTLGDCLPMVLSEAGAAGLPLVSTRLAAIPEIVKHGQSGFLVQSGDAADLKAALSALVSDPELRQRLGAQALEIVKRDFDAGQNVQRLLNLLKLTVEEEERRLVTSHSVGVKRIL